MDAPLEIGLGLENTHVIVTGAAGQIGQIIVKAFLAAGAYVSGFDIKSPTTNYEHNSLSWYKVDVTDELALEEAFVEASRVSGLHVTACVAAAGLDLSFITHHTSICDMPLNQWTQTMSVNATGTFLTARAWLRSIKDHAAETSRNVSLVIIGSEAGVFGVPGNADYAASKAAIQYGLMRSLAPEAVRIFQGARVNAIAPGAVDTPQFRKECTQDDYALYQESEATVATRRSIATESVAKTCLMLTSDNFSRNISSQIIQVDGGKSGRLLWHANGSPAW